MDAGNSLWDKLSTTADDDSLTLAGEVDDNTELVGEFLENLEDVGKGTASQWD